MLRTKGNYSNTFVTEYMMVICPTTVDWYHYTMLVPMDTMKWLNYYLRLLW